MPNGRVVLGGTLLLIAVVLEFDVYTTSDWPSYLQSWGNIGAVILFVAGCGLILSAYSEAILRL